MQIFRDTHSLPAALKGAVYAIGNFDGLHRGHRAVIEAAAHRARKMGRASAIITFEPHSRNFFQPDQPRARLTPMKLKAELMAQMNVDILFNLRFNRQLASLPAADFVKKYIARTIGRRAYRGRAEFSLWRQKAGRCARARGDGRPAWL